jgi:hypothetical protein
MSDENEGYKKAKEVSDKLKAETAEEQARKEANKEVAVKELNQMAELRNNTQLAQMYSENATVGAENLAGELPLLKVHQVGKSTKNELSDGSEPTDGWFFYKPNAEQFQTIECHILTISRGFKAAGLEDGKEIFNQIMAGVIIDNGDYKPFIIYMTGLKLSYLWEFGKAANKYTHQKPIPIPMFALTVKLTTEKIANNFGKSWIVKFEIEKGEDSVPKLVMDPGVFQFLKDNVTTVKETIESLIAAKTNVKEDESIPGVASEEGAMPF